MAGESRQGAVAASNLGRGKYAPKKIPPPRERISFRDLAKVAAPKKTREFLSAHTGCDDSTAKRWLSGKSRAPAGAVYAVLADIFARID
jgi:hypothetical protein